MYMYLDNLQIHGRLYRALRQRTPEPFNTLYKEDVCKRNKDCFLSIVRM